MFVFLKNIFASGYSWCSASGLFLVYRKKYLDIPCWNTSHFVMTVNAPNCSKINFKILWRKIMKNYLLVKKDQKTFFETFPTRNRFFKIIFFIIKVRTFSSNNYLRCLYILLSKFGSFFCISMQSKTTGNYGLWKRLIYFDKFLKG